MRRSGEEEEDEEEGPCVSDNKRSFEQQVPASLCAQPGVAGGTGLFHHHEHRRESFLG